MIDTEPTLTDLNKRLAEAQRQLRNARSVRMPDELSIRRLESVVNTAMVRVQRLKTLTDEVKELERTVSLKMMNRYPEEKPFRTEYKRQLTRLNRQLREFVNKYEPKKPPVRALSYR